MAQSVCRVVIRKPFHDFIFKKAKELCTNDLGEVVNYLVMQQMKLEASGTTASCAPQTETLKEDYSNLSELQEGLR